MPNYGLKRSLADADVGERVIVKKIASKLKRRLLEMGLTSGTEVTIVRKAPLGDPIDVIVRGYQLSLRLNEAKEVEVE